MTDQRDVFQDAWNDIKTNLWVLSPGAQSRIYGHLMAVSQDAYKRGKIVGAKVFGSSSLQKAFKELLAHAERSTCNHEEMHRAGTIWTVCDNCSMQWADDRGGPPKPGEWPQWIKDAQDVLKDIP